MSEIKIPTMDNVLAELDDLIAWGEKNAHLEGTEEYAEKLNRFDYLVCSKGKEFIARANQNAALAAEAGRLRAALEEIANHKPMKELAGLPCPTTFSLEAAMGRHDWLVNIARTALSGGDS